MRSAAIRVCTVLIGLVLVGKTSAAETVATVGDASIVQDAQTGLWTISAGGSSLTLAAGPGRDFQALRLVTASNASWIAAAPDTTVTINGRSLRFGSRADGFRFQSVDTSTSGVGLELDVTYNYPGARLRLTRHYAVTSGSPTFETWTTFAPTGTGDTALSDLNAFRLTIPAGTVRWLNGLQGDSAGDEHDSAFTLQQQDLAIGDHLALGAASRSSEQTVPWFAVDGAQDEFYASLMWSGAWSLTVDRSDIGLALVFGLAPMSTRPGVDPIDGPHAVFGVVPGGLAEASAALRSYVLNAVRAGRPLTPLVTYNTWFAYGTSIDEASMLDEMTHAAALGAELFVVDAGWYSGAGANGSGDFTSGLGSWQVDPARFPTGLQALTDRAHALGMKFGLWVEPERLDRSTLGDNGAQEAWLATSGGSYGSDQSGQICFASADARAWVLGQLTALIDAVQPDYLKWDNNMFVNCDRSGHGHGAGDGNFAHVNGLYQVLAALRVHYPELIIENVSGGGNRLDLGMLRYTDVAWMDDRSVPSLHVRHNLEGLSVIFPPAYLLSFLMDYPDEPLNGGSDLPLYVRSRMAGVLGLCFRGAELTATDAAAIAGNVGLYKSFRDTLSLAAGALLTSQAEPDNGPPWDVLQETSADGSAMVISAFQSDEGVETVTVKPIGLDPSTTYRVDSADVGELGTATGSDLMDYGIDVVSSTTTSAHILVITAQP